MARSIQEKCILCIDVNIGQDATERDQPTPLVGSLPLAEPFPSNPRGIPRSFPLLQCSRHKSNLEKEGDFQRPLHVRNRLDLGVCAQAVSSMLSGIQGLAKEQREEGSHAPDE